MADGYTAASMISGKELAIQMGFPKRSISGLSVVYKVPFGRNVIKAGKSENTIEVGKIYHMGQTTKEKVELDLNSLTSHVFIAGSTGTGKSNAVYKIMKNIKDENKDIHFLVVEPAKGEYKHVFKDECHVYGTNPKKSDLLRINPFSFPDDVHVLEHIDRLVEIMNVCWPMYAAMPAILKNAVIKSYEKCGWDLINSCIPTGEKTYPNFADILNNIHEILENSAFSQDNKGDYIGALCTRVESLTYGLNGQIFTSNEVSNEELFDEDVIVDLSRVEPSDNKALIMGILVMKLQEYRLSMELEPNQMLSHVVILEEAHNILKKTSTDQTMEGSNLTGKSVEMLTNAIAEMRTYGESFFIVDQAPDLLDRAVIRNTNTKIVFRLPDDEDRKLVGRAMALSDEQVLELSKLEVGCAAIYQNDWEEAVLCQFEQFHKASDELFEYSSPGKIKPVIEVKKDILRSVLDVACKHKIDDVRLEKAEKELENLQIDIELKQKLKCILSKKNKCELKDVSPLVVRLFDCGNAIEKCRDSADIETWNENIIMAVNPELRKMSKWYMDTFIQCLMIEQTRKNPDFAEYAEAWKEDMEVK
jgi:hypothetical protein